MSSIDQFRMLSRYNSWMNEKIYAACSELSDSARKKDSKAFFGSIHRTLDHIVYGDLAWLERLRDDRFTPRPIENALYESWGELKVKRFSLDKEIDEWINQLTLDSLDSLDELFTYTSNVDNLTRTVPYWALVTHLFNHQTHHRGQVTTLLSQLSIDPTDIPFLPEFSNENI